MELSDALKRFRKNLGITQKQAAVGAGVAERLYQSYEYGKVVPSATVLIALADYFDVSLDYLVGRSDVPCVLRDANVEMLSPDEQALIAEHRKENN